MRRSVRYLFWLVHLACVGGVCAAIGFACLLVSPAASSRLPVIVCLSGTGAVSVVVWLVAVAHLGRQVNPPLYFIAFWIVLAMGVLVAIGILDYLGMFEFWLLSSDAA